MAKSTNTAAARKIPADKPTAAVDLTKPNVGARKSPAVQLAAVGEPASAHPAAALSATKTKSAQLIALLEAEHGASIAELVAALDWQPHTTRAALTGLRKKGHEIVKTNVDDTTRYSIAAKVVA